MMMIMIIVIIIKRGSLFIFCENVPWRHFNDDCFPSQDFETNYEVVGFLKAKCSCLRQIKFLFADVFLWK